MGSMAAGPFLVLFSSTLLLVCVLLLFERRRLLKFIREEALAKSALGESIVRFHMIVESSAAATYVFRGGRFVMVNASMEAITGYSREELLAMKGLEHIHPDHRPAALERNAVRERGESAPTRYELKLLTKSGDIRWVDFTARTVLFDGEVCTVGSAFDITSRKKAEEALKERERLWRTMVETSPDGIATATLDGVVTSVSKRCIEMWGYDEPDELVGRHMLEFVEAGCHDKARHFLGEMLKGNYTGPAEYLMVRRDGSSFYVEANAEILRDDSGKPTGFFFAERDVTDRKQAEEALRESEAKYRFLTESMKDVIWTLDVATLRFVYVSPSVERLRGYTPEEIMAEPLDAALTPESAALVRRQIDEGMKKFTKNENIPNSVFHTEVVEQPRKDGTTVWTEVVTGYWRNPRNGRIEIHGVTRDISERKEVEAKIAHMAQHDPLTGLPNRALFADRLERALAASRRSGIPTALMFLDLDQFKPVNDTYGHAVGDVLLQQAAERMKSALRASDTVGRIGGDEFVVLLPAVERREDAIHVAEMLLAVLREPFSIERRSVEISCSIGIAIHPEDGRDEIELAKNADTAMYWAKRDGGDCARLFRTASDVSVATL
ncbi:MAG: PAS domain S-box protein [Synergistaceae bacterium]|nr:PAS domain S-box protein [Synergistaceae bacterium]